MIEYNKNEEPIQFISAGQPGPEPLEHVPNPNQAPAIPAPKTP